MRVDPFFAAPLIVTEVDPSVRESIRRKVSEFMQTARAEETVTPAPEESVATSFYRSDASILVDAGLEELEAHVLATAREYLEKTLKLPPREIEVEHAWINVFEPGSQENHHTHDGSLLSCSYYVEAPEECGCIVFPDPIGARRSYREFTRTSGQELLNRREIAVEPRPGMLVMFESWMPHYIQCNKSDRIRISIAINLRGLPEAAVSSRAASAGVTSGQADAVGERAAPEADSPQQGPDGQPFLFNDLFDVNPNFGLMLQPIKETIPVAIIDDFLQDPERVRQVVGSMPATNWKLEPGTRNFVDYYDCRLRIPIRYPNKVVGAAQQVVHKVYGQKTRPADPSVDVNWFRQIKDKRADFAVPHADITEGVARSFTCVLYLNRSEECSGGTAFFRCTKTDSPVFDDAYARLVTTDQSMAETGLDYWPEKNQDAWEQIGVLDMLPGRLVIFPSEYFHAAYHPQNSFFDFPRLSLVFWLIN
ncbi:MAG: TIGR02466 family protein [Gammaproteobacteria bacterium]|jgi:uncharacterized protein (TIGR02466 family)